MDTRCTVENTIKRSLNTEIQILKDIVAYRLTIYQKQLEDLRAENEFLRNQLDASFGELEQKIAENKVLCEFIEENRLKSKPKLQIPFDGIKDTVEDRLVVTETYLETKIEELEWEKRRRKNLEVSFSVAMFMFSNITLKKIQLDFVTLNIQLLERELYISKEKLK